jgi:hypothetical protein
VGILVHDPLVIIRFIRVGVLYRAEAVCDGDGRSPLGGFVQCRSDDDTLLLVSDNGEPLLPTTVLNPSGRDMIKSKIFNFLQVAYISVSISSSEASDPRRIFLLAEPW